MSDLQISDAELEVMKVLWQQSPRTSAELVKTLQQTTDWAAPTIKSLLVRLVKKGAVLQSGEGRCFQYRPLVDYETYTERQSVDFLDKFFGGAPQRMLSFFVEKNKLSANDLKLLQELIEDAGKHE
ncbi:BlaI/MecI/CopY family transcriptional regulator [Victivallis sp. Marseille-Q1083]|uniref:BlaI/MecI/CopY family transcriptional regulator n=1 Tax=Victivallis sp. Marseille-Q1083 TaxID=2717288 RepID=UPI00158F2A30|nr:BlaI/MecI/CopY family transcriptional regulator [Victivallis sp. Marseille-Q1083]